jgi:hypothetical protein
MDWSGSENQRRTDRDDCIYPGAKPTPKPTSYFVPKGTRALMKRTGDKKWQNFTTRRDLTFDSAYRATDKSLVFFSVGFLLCVGRQHIEMRTEIV